MNIEEIIKFIILWIIQGVAEVLPISSSGHLIIIGTYFGVFQENETLDVFLHVASLIAVVYYLRKEIINIVKYSFRYIFKKEKEHKTMFNYLLCLTISTVITAGFGLVLSNFSDIFKKPLIVAIFLLINGTMLLFVSRKVNEKHNKEISIKNSIIIGLAQGIGVLPGISRSGVTISSGVVQGIDKESMTKYSFLLFIPATIGALLLNVESLTVIPNTELLAYILSFAFALITTYFSLKLLFQIVRKNKTDFFAYYCYGVSAIVLIYELFIK